MGVDAPVKPVAPVDPQVAVDSLGPLTLPSFAPPRSVSPTASTQPALARPDAAFSGGRPTATASGGHTPARAPAVARQPGADLWGFLSHLMPAVRSPFTWPTRMPDLAKTWLQGAFGHDGKTEVAAALVAALISMISLVTAGAALTRRRLSHLHWRAHVRRYRRDLGWPVVADTPSADGGAAAEIFDVAPGHDATTEGEVRAQAPKPSRRRHAA